MSRTGTEDYGQNLIRGLLAGAQFGLMKQELEASKYQLAELLETRSHRDKLAEITRRRLDADTKLTQAQTQSAELSRQLMQEQLAQAKLTNPDIARSTKADARSREAGAKKDEADALNAQLGTVGNFGAFVGDTVGPNDLAGVLAKQFGITEPAMVSVLGNVVKASAEQVNQQKAAIEQKTSELKAKQDTELLESATKLASQLTSEQARAVAKGYEDAGIPIPRDLQLAINMLSEGRVIPTSLTASQQSDRDEFAITRNRELGKTAAQLVLELARLEQEEEDLKNVPNSFFSGVGSKRRELKSRIAVVKAELLAIEKATGKKKSVDEKIAERPAKNSDQELIDKLTKFLPNWRDWGDSSDRPINSVLEGLKSSTGLVLTPNEFRRLAKQEFK